MIYLLDTDILIYLIRGLKTKQRGKNAADHRGRAQQLVTRCQQAQADRHAVGISAVTASELEYGARRSEDHVRESEAVRKILLPFELYDYEAVTCAEPYGRVRRELELAGEVIGALDLLIAAHALSLGATLVTNNERHFSRVAGLPVENWTVKSP